MGISIKRITASALLADSAMLSASVIPAASRASSTCQFTVKLPLITKAYTPFPALLLL